MGAAFHSDTIFAKGRGESERRSDTLFGLPKNCERKGETEGREGIGHFIEHLHTLKW